MRPSAPPAPRPAPPRLRTRPGPPQLRCSPRGAGLDSVQDNVTTSMHRAGSSPAPKHPVFRLGLPGTLSPHRTTRRFPFVKKIGASDLGEFVWPRALSPASITSPAPITLPAPTTLPASQQQPPRDRNISHRARCSGTRSFILADINLSEKFVPFCCPLQNEGWENQGASICSQYGLFWFSSPFIYS